MFLIIFWHEVVFVWHDADVFGVGGAAIAGEVVEVVVVVDVECDCGVVFGFDEFEKVNAFDVTGVEVFGTTDG